MEASSTDLEFQGRQKRDCDLSGERLKERTVVTKTGETRGMRLADFFEDERVKKSKVKIEHVAVLRLYTTAAFRYINDPLRDLERRRANEPHPLPVICQLLMEASKALGSAEYELNPVESKLPKDLFRGMQGVKLPENFLEDGGVEIAPMSTTADLKIAMQYSLSTSSVLLRIATKNAGKRGVPVRWLSAFPGEEEILYPPLTMLEATGDTEVFTKGTLTWTIVSVEPTLA